MNLGIVFIEGIKTFAAYYSTNVFVSKLESYMDYKLEL